MSGTVYALHVGINDYGGNPSPLFGCRADAETIRELLQTRIGPDDFKPLSLLDQEATRQRIIDGFEQHLAQAGEGDVALFTFSGHGSYEPVEDRFRFLEPTGQNQTIVCADSRTKKTGDLADKELNELIRSVADNGPHVLVILDCCHSGGGTRDPSDVAEGVRVRLAPPVAEPRPIDGYLPRVRDAIASAISARDAAPVAGAGAGSPPAPGFGHPRHIALSACEPTQLSKEIDVDGATRGAFSLGFQRALTTLPDTATYRQLMIAAANGVRNRVSDQNPVWFVEREELDQPFLGGAVQPRPATIVLQHERDGWFIDAGSIHGIQPPREGRATVLAVRGVVGAPAPAEALGTIRVKRVESSRSAVEAVGFTPEEGKQYDAVLTMVPSPAAVVELRGEPAGIELVRAALGDAARVCEAVPGDGDGDGGSEPRFVVLAADGRLAVARADATPLTDAVLADAGGAERTVSRLEHLARWHEIRDLVNPTSRLAGQVGIEIVAGADGQAAPPADAPALEPDETGVFRLHYADEGAGGSEPYMFVRLRNDSDRSLYCTLLDMTDRFRSHAKLFPVEEVAAGTTTYAWGTRPIPFRLPDDRIAAGGTEVRDWLKLIASEQTFEASSYELAMLEGVVPFERTTGTRDAGDEEAERKGAVTTADWTTAIVCVVTERPADTVAVPAAGVADVAGGAVSVEAHPALAAARARLGTAAAASRAAETRGAAPTALVRDPAVAVPLRLGAARAVTETAPDHLELVGEIDPTLVSADAPLRVRLRATVDDGDVVLAVAREGDLFIPLGTGLRAAGDIVELALARLPEGELEAGATRGVGRSIRIFFQRILARRLGLDPGWPRLSLVTVATDAHTGEVTVDLDYDVDAIRGAVAAADRVLLVVHGLLGDTRSMLPDLHAVVGDRYGAVLAFDFDSIGAAIPETAQALADRLTAAGVPGEDEAPRLDIVAVSSGALVVRWLAERLAGAGMVRRAVLAGVPNAGTPWAAIEGWVTGTLAIGLNGLATIVWPAAVFGSLAAALERFDHGIDDLAPGSAVLTELATVDGPAAAYTVLAGNAALGAGAEVDRDDGRLGRLLRRLGRHAAGLAFLRQPNDLVATTASIAALPPTLDPAPSSVEIACDHLTYLTEPAATRAIAEALG